MFASEIGIPIRSLSSIVLKAAVIANPCINLIRMSNTESPYIEQRVSKVNGQVTMRRYEKKRVLGKGGFATCYLVESCETKKQYAAKVISKSILLKPKTKQKLMSEIRIHKAVSHKNIVQFYHVFENEYNVYILLEVCASSNMYELIRKRKKLTVPEVQYYVYQLVQALSYLHNSMVIHRDVKLGNLFINDRMELKLGDFGLAAKLEFPGERKRTVCGTPNYIAPEIIENLKGHSFEVDIWSTGVIMYIFLTGHPPFQTDNLEKTYKRIKAGDFTIPSSMNKEAGDLLKKMLVVDPSKRATFQQILAHPFMNPPGGIVKTLPIRSLTEVPNLRENEKYSQEEMRMTRINSITTIKPDLEYNIEHFEDTETKPNRSNSVTSLFKSMLSPVAKMERSNSSQLLKSNEQRQFVSKEKELKDRSKTNSILLKKKEIWVTSSKFEVVMSYALSNGMAGTCESNYKLVYSKANNIYFEIVDDNVKKIPGEKAGEQILNRRKFLFNVKSDHEEVSELPNTKSIIYVKRVFKTAQAIVFMLSNGVNQVTFPDSGNILLATDEDLVLIPKGNYDELVREKKQNCYESKKIDIVKGYRIMMEILNKAG